MKSDVIWEVVVRFRSLFQDPQSSTLLKNVSGIQY